MHRALAYKTLRFSLSEAFTRKLAYRMRRNFRGV